MKLKTVFLMVLLSSVLLLFTVNDSYSQRVVKNYNEAVTANPLALAFGVLNINYEMQVSRENSATIGVVYYGYQGWSGAGLNGIYKWYLFQDNEKALKGFGFGPSVALGYLGYENDSYDNKITLAIGGEASFKWIFDDFVLEPVFGINYNVLNQDGINWRPFYLGVNIGYAW